MGMPAAVADGAGLATAAAATAAIADNPTTAAVLTARIAGKSTTCPDGALLRTRTQEHAHRGRYVGAGQVQAHESRSR